MRLAWVFFSCAAAAAAQPYDVLLKGGHVIDPANGIDAVMDVAISGSRLAAVRAAIGAAEARKIVDVTGLYVVPGLVDLHVHVFGYDGALDPDDTSLVTGVTTAVDAGGSGWRTFDEFQRTVIARSRTRVLVWLNIVGAGMVGEPGESNTADMDSEKTADKIRRHRDVIVGIKTAHFGGKGWTAIDRAVGAGRLANVPVMVDDKIFTGTGRTTREELLEHFRPGDIHTHMYNDRQMELIDRFTSRVQPYMVEARQRGVKFDLGHGAGSFLWPVASKAMAQGFIPDTISTDLHGTSILGPQPDLPNCMSKLMLLGMSLNEAVVRATVNPAKGIGRYPEVGTLSVGRTADIAVLDLEDGVFAFKDSWGAKRLGTKRLENAMTIRAGEIVYERAGAPRRPAEPPEAYDILLKNGQVVDPANHRAGRMDVAVIAGKIARVAPDLPAANARMAIDASRYYVTPGLIDIEMNFADYHSLPNGVTTAVAVRAAQPSARAKTRMLAFADPERAAELKGRYPDFVVGVRASAANIERAVKVADQLQTIVMLDDAQNTPDAVKRLRPGDIAPWLPDARGRGFTLDAGRGFPFHAGRQTIAQGFFPDMISALTSANTLLNLGMTAEQVVERATINLARAIRRPDLGTLSVGAEADIAVLAVEEGQFAFVDSERERIIGDRRLRAAMTIRKGAIVWDSDGLSAPDWITAGPYTNFK